MGVVDKNLDVITYAVSLIVKAVIKDSRLPEKGRFLSHPSSPLSARANQGV